MANKTPKGTSARAKTGNGGETHQNAGGPDQWLTTNQGTPISDNQNSLKSGERGPRLLEDFVLREKITHFDHERIPERIVHARGSGGARLFPADEIDSPSSPRRRSCRTRRRRPGVRALLHRRRRRRLGRHAARRARLRREVLHRGRQLGSGRQQHPGVLHPGRHQVSRSRPRGEDGARPRLSRRPASAHDTFWDFASLMPESMHMLMWAMSDRAIPRSFRMMEGFGVHTFRLDRRRGQIDLREVPLAADARRCVRRLGRGRARSAAPIPTTIAATCSRRSRSGDFPEWEFGIQAFDQKIADGFAVRHARRHQDHPRGNASRSGSIGRMVLDRNPDNFFAETEQVAFHPGQHRAGHRLHQRSAAAGPAVLLSRHAAKSRLGGANFHELPINAPSCPMRNFQRDGADAP